VISHAKIWLKTNISKTYSDSATLVFNRTLTQLIVQEDFLCCYIPVHVNCRNECAEGLE